MDEYKLRTNRLYQYWRFEKFTQWDNQREKIGPRVEQENEGLLK